MTRTLDEALLDSMPAREIGILTGSPLWAELKTAVEQLVTAEDTASALLTRIAPDASPNETLEILRAAMTATVTTAPALSAEDAHLQRLVQAAADFYTGQYTGSGAQRYMHARFGPVIDTAGYTIGYAPAGWTTLVDHLRATLNAADADLVAAGLATVSKRGTLIDIFRDRVTFAVTNSAGLIVGFSARCAPGAPAGTPKYINSPTTTIFDKGQLLFGLDEGRAALNRGATPVRVEGPMDAVAITLAGQGSAVGLAPMGTALTDDQAALITAAAPASRIVLAATDADAAGRAAAARDFATYTAHGLDPRELILSSHLDQQTPKDPAEAFEHDPGSLTIALQLPSIAPSLASTLIRDMLTDPNVDTDNLHKRYAIAAAAGRLIHQLPASARDQEIASAAAAIAHLTNTLASEPDYAHIIANPPEMSDLDDTMAP